MLRKITAVVLLVALVSVNLSRYFVYAGFELNKKYIATTLCENKDKPWMHCNGHCYFMKKIKAAQDAEKSQSRESQKNLFQEVFVAAALDMTFHTELLEVISTPYQEPQGITNSTTLFRPPRLG